MFHIVVRRHKLDEVENKSTLHNSIVLAIFVLKIVKVGKKLTKLWKKTILTVFWKQGVYGLTERRTGTVVKKMQAKFLNNIKIVSYFWLSLNFV